SPDYIRRGRPRCSPPSRPCGKKRSRRQAMLRDLLTESVDAMKHNRRRTMLTMLGMAWGIATVVLLLAYGSGFERAIEAIFSNFGTKLIGVFPGRTSLQDEDYNAGVQAKLTMEDIDRRH